MRVRTGGSIEDRGYPFSVWVQVGALAILFLGGGAAGVGLSRYLVPGSFLAQFVGLFTFPVPFVIGLQSWLGLALGVAMWRTAAHGPAKPGERLSEIPAGSIAFVPVSVMFVGGAGLLIGLLGSSLGILATLGLYVLLGFGYGMACWLAARSGYLPFPQE
jgi:hypothetical protein